MAAPCCTPEPPYYAVIFTSARVGGPVDADYDATSARMVELAHGIEGFLGVDSARESVGITVSYWRDLDAIARWRVHAEHRLAQERGRRDWYDTYTLRIARVESQRSFVRRP